MKSQTSALSPVELNEMPIILPPETPTRKSPRKTRNRSPSPSSPVRRSPRLRAKESLAPSAHLEMDLQLSPPVALPESLMSSPERVNEDEDQIGDTTMGMSPQANPPNVRNQTPKPYFETDTVMIFGDDAMSFANPDPDEQAPAVHLPVSPHKRHFEEVGTPELTITSPLPVNGRPMATPVRHVRPRSSFTTLVPPETRGRPIESPSRQSAEPQTLSPTRPSSSSRGPSFARPTRASLAHNNGQPSPHTQDSPSKMIRLSQIPELGPKSSVVGTPRSPSPRSPTAARSPRLSMQTPRRLGREVPSSPMRRTLSPVRSSSSRKAPPSSAIGIEALLTRIGAELDPTELKQLDVRVELSGTRYAQSIVSLQKRAQQLEAQLEKMATDSTVAPGVEPLLKTYKDKLDKATSIELVQDEIQSAKELLHKETVKLSETKHQFMQHQTLSARERNLKARIAEYEKLLQQRPVTASKLSSVMKEIEQKERELSKLRVEVDAQAKTLHEENARCDSLMEDVMNQQNASNDKESTARARLEQARNQVKLVVDQFKMRGITWSPNGFVLHHRFLEILYDRKSKTQKFTLLVENPVFDHYFALLDKTKSIRTNLELWGTALNTYHLLNDVRALGFNQWIKRGDQLVLRQRVPQGTVEITLDRGLPRVSAKIHDKELEKKITDFESLSELLASQR